MDSSGVYVYIFKGKKGNDIFLAIKINYNDNEKNIYTFLWIFV